MIIAYDDYMRSADFGVQADTPFINGYAKSNVSKPGSVMGFGVPVSFPFTVDQDVDAEFTGTLPVNVIAWGGANFENSRQDISFELKNGGASVWSSSTYTDESGLIYFETAKNADQLIVTLSASGVIYPEVFLERVFVGPVFTIPCWSPAYGKNCGQAEPTRSHVNGHAKAPDFTAQDVRSFSTDKRRILKPDDVTNMRKFFSYVGNGADAVVMPNDDSNDYIFGGVQNASLVSDGAGMGSCDFSIKSWY